MYGIERLLPVVRSPFRVLVGCVVVGTLTASLRANPNDLPNHGWIHKVNAFTMSMNGELIPVEMELFLAIDASERGDGRVVIAPSEFTIRSPARSRFPAEIFVTTGGTVEAAMFAQLPKGWFADTYSGSLWELTGFDGLAGSHTRFRSARGTEIGTSVDWIDSTGNHLDMNQICSATLTSNFGNETSWEHTSTRIVLQPAVETRGRAAFVYEHEWANQGGDVLSATTEGEISLRGNPLADIDASSPPLTLLLETEVSWEDRDNSDGVMRGVVEGTLLTQ